jgi:hypothetical protein
MPKFTSATASLYGALGGLATAERHGAAHMARIGRRGYEATRDRYFAGDDALMCQWLQRKGLHAIDARMRETMPWLSPIVADPGTMSEFYQKELKHDND